MTPEKSHRWDDQKSNQVLEDKFVINCKIECSPKLHIFFVSFSLYSFTQFEYYLVLDIPNISRKSTAKYSTNYCSASKKTIIYLAIPHILSANSEQAHQTLVSYLKVIMTRSGVVCWLLI